MRGVESFEAGHAPDENDEETAFEPFNLERERREGYFDDDGNYVRNESDAEDEKDAWLDDVHADARLSTAGDKLAVRKDSDNEGEETTDADVANIKRELCAYLEPGETVLDALKRLGGASAAGTERPSRQPRRGKPSLPWMPKARSRSRRSRS